MTYDGKTMRETWNNLFYWLNPYLRILSEQDQQAWGYSVPFIAAGASDA